MTSEATKRSGYSLIELLVVLAVITLISLSSLPNIFGRNDRLSLDTSANRIRSMIIDARTRSLAPSGRDAGSLGQIYQVSIGEFQTGQTNYTASGSPSTTSLALERGSSRCDPADSQGGFTRIRELKLPRNIYVQSFFPANPAGNETKMAVRFTVGKVGFLCGGAANPSIDSTNFTDPSWIGQLRETAGATRARYLVITVAAQKLTEKRYVVIDRQTSEVTVHKTDPQEFFTPFSDVLAPKWTDVNEDNFRMSLNCGNGQPSEVTLFFPRAEDRITDPEQTDPNLAIFYDISWQINNELAGGGRLFRPLAIRYYYDVRQGFETVQYTFETTTISVSQQRFTVLVNVTASDQGANLQPAFVAGNPADELLRSRQKSFFIDCGIGAVEEEGVIRGTEQRNQADPEIINNSCSQLQISRFFGPGRYADSRLWRRLAAPPSQPSECGEVT